MKLRKSGVFPAVVAVVAALWCPGVACAAGGAVDLVREALLQQSAAQRVGCSGVQQTLKDGADATLVVRTAVELGYSSCEVIRCALQGKADPKSGPCEKVILGAVQAGVQPDVISRCSEEFCDPAAVAAILGDAFLEPYFCYFAGQPLVAPEVDPPQMWVIDRTPPLAQASPFAF